MPKLARRILFGLLALAALLTLAAALAARPLANRLRTELESAVAEACEPCELRIEQARIGISPPRVELSGLSLRQGDPRDSAVQAEADSVTVPVPLYNLGGSPWLLGLVRVENLRVLLHEGDLTLKKTEKPAEAGGRPFDFECGGIAVSGASFTYRKDSPAGAAYLRFTQVVADIGPFGNFGAWVHKPLKGLATAQLEGSGSVRLEAETRLDEEGPWVDVKLRVRGQKLREVNGYFRPEEGVRLSGLLLDSDATVKVRGSRAEGSVMARYEGLEVFFHENRHRGALSALLNNLGALVKVNKGNSGEPRSERERAVVTKRHAKESVVSFILRTLKEAVLRVAT